MSTTTTSSINRRTFLKRATAVTLVAVVGGSVYRAVDNGVFSAGQGAAYEPWTNWQMDQGKSPLSLVRAAILAANPHNSQPWLFRVSETQIEVYADTTRQIGMTDPFLREMYTGVGCALENLLLAAQVEGYEAVITYVRGCAVDEGTPGQSQCVRVFPGIGLDILKGDTEAHQALLPYG